MFSVQGVLRYEVDKRTNHLIKSHEPFNKTLLKSYCCVLLYLENKHYRLKVVASSSLRPCNVLIHSPATPFLLTKHEGLTLLVCESQYVFEGICPGRGSLLLCPMSMSSVFIWQVSSASSSCKIMALITSSWRNLDHRQHNSQKSLHH